MSTSIAKQLRLPKELCDSIDTEIQNTGMTFTDFVIYALYSALQRKVASKIRDFLDFSRELADWLQSTYSKTDFPQDVTKKLFEHIQGDGGLLQRYRALIQGETEVDRHFRADVHRQIGKMVKRVLDAKVIGRSTPLNREEHLIESYSLLAPLSD